MKHEWRKKEKSLYLPKTSPEFINIPNFNFVSIRGSGNPNHPSFGEYITVLYSISYAIKMTLKKVEKPPKHYQDFIVYPLEGVWDISEEAKKSFSGTINKDDLIFDLMIRQPKFVSTDFYQEMLEFVKKKKPHPLLDQVQFKQVKDGPSIQMMHIGPYDEEVKSFNIMEEFAEAQGLSRQSKIHREIYISDFRKVAPEKLKTVLRFGVN